MASTLLSLIEGTLDIARVEAGGLDEIDAADAAHGGFVAHLRALAQQCQLDAMTRILRQALSEQKAA